MKKIPPKVCLTASGCLIFENKVLLVKHKKLGFWLCQGGHIDEDELPHQAAEREFWEETSLKVRAIRPKLKAIKSKFMPLPIAANLHWISQENYNFRVKGTKRSQQTIKNWQKGCEQHYNLFFLVKSVAGLDFKQNTEETDGIAWFEQKELADLETKPDIRAELELAFKLSNIQK